MEQMSSAKKERDRNDPKCQVRKPSFPEPYMIDKRVPISSANIKHRVNLQNALHKRRHIFRRPENGRNPETNLRQYSDNIDDVLDER